MRPLRLKESLDVRTSQETEVGALPEEVSLQQHGRSGSLGVSPASSIYTPGRNPRAQVLHLVAQSNTLLEQPLAKL